MCYFRNLRRVVGKRWPPAALTWSSTPVPCPHRQTSSSNSSRCPRKWFQQHCSSPCPASFCERAKPRKSSPLHHLKPADYTHPEGMLSLQITLLFLSLHFFFLCLRGMEWQYLTFPAFLSLDLSPLIPFSLPLWFHPVFICTPARFSLLLSGMFLPVWEFEAFYIRVYANLFCQLI